MDHAKRRAKAAKSLLQAQSGWPGTERAVRSDVGSMRGASWPPHSQARHRPKQRQAASAHPDRHPPPTASAPLLASLAWWRSAGAGEESPRGAELIYHQFYLLNYKFCIEYRRVVQTVQHPRATRTVTKRLGGREGSGRADPTGVEQGVAAYLSMPATSIACQCILG